MKSEAVMRGISVGLTKTQHTDDARDVFGGIPNVVGQVCPWSKMVRIVG